MIIFPLLLAGSLLSCKKPNPDLNYINPDFKKYFDYKEGSYWIFYDSLNKLVDSFTVTRYSVKSPQIVGPNEDIGITIAGRNEWSLAISAPAFCAFDVGLGNKFHYHLANNMPFDTGLFTDKSLNISWTIKLLPNFSMNNIVYNNAHEILYTYTGTIYADTFYINEDKGFLAVLLNNEYAHKRLFLNKCAIIR